MPSSCPTCKGQYTGAFSRCQFCGEPHWFGEAYTYASFTRLPGPAAERGFCAKHTPTGVCAYGPTRETALADLRRKVEMREAEPDLRPSVPVLSREAPREYGPGDLGVFDGNRVVFVPGEHGKRAIMRPRPVQRLDAYRTHCAIARGITAFAEWVGRVEVRRTPMRITWDSTGETVCFGCDQPLPSPYAGHECPGRER